MDRVNIVHENFINRVKSADYPDPVSKNDVLTSLKLSDAQMLEIFRSQVISRQIDRASRKMQAQGEGFYTIGSSGHEGMAAIAKALRLNDMAFLHYRDAAFQIQRSNQLANQTPIRDMLLSYAAAADDPISGGRHKVLGSKALFIPPQTSTIASHLPKAVGAAFSIGLAKRLKPKHQVLPDDGVILCSFGDASANHSTAQGAFNTAGWTACRGGGMPILFVCEDNGIGISTKTPENWIKSNFANRPWIKYFECNGLDFEDTYHQARLASEYVRESRKPAFLQLKCIRLYGHAGSDVASSYLDIKDIEKEEAQDPLLHSARIMTENDVLDNAEILNLYSDIAKHIEREMVDVIKRPKIRNSSEVMASIIPPFEETESAKYDEQAREAVLGKDYAQMKAPQHMARLLNWALADLMLENKNIVLAGEDIGPKGGVYNVTSKLHERFGSTRVVNTILDEQSILGLAIGMAHNGFLPIPEIQFLAYLHNAEDQLRGEAATLSFFSNGQYSNGMVVRIAGLGYQKGFGGHFHNDNSLNVLRDIPGVIIACPSGGRDGALMLRECVRLARDEKRVVVFIEPIALYMTRDLHEEKDGLWMEYYPSPDEKNLGLGDIGQFGDGEDLAIVTYGNGYFLSRQAEAILKEKHGANIRIVDLRWLAPLSEQRILAAVAPCRKILIVDECRKTGSHSEALMTLFSENGVKPSNVARLTAHDSFIALGRAATHTLPGCDDIVGAAVELIG